MLSTIITYFHIMGIWYNPTPVIVEYSIIAWISPTIIIFSFFVILSHAVVHKRLAADMSILLLLLLLILRLSLVGSGSAYVVKEVRHIVTAS